MADDVSCRSARTHVIGAGGARLPLDEARRDAVTQIERCERVVLAARANHAEAVQVVREAVAERNRRSTDLLNAEEALRRARQQALYLLSGSSDISRPVNERGPEHDLDCMILDGIPEEPAGAADG